MRKAMTGKASLRNSNLSSPLIIYCMGRFNYKLLLLLLVITGLASCVKDPQDIPEGGVIDDPAFRISGSFDGNNVIIEAGNDNWTAFPSTISLDSSVVYTSTFSKFG